MLYRVADGVDELIKAVREELLARADLIKVMCSGGVFEASESEAWVQFTEAELAALVDEAAAQSRPVAAHAHPAEAIKRAARAGVRTIEHGSYPDDEAIELLKALNVALVPTFVVYRTLADHPNYPGLHDRARRVFEAKFAPFARAMEAGCSWGVGSDYSDLFAEPDSLIAEIEILIRHVGMSAAEVIRAATRGNAELMGVSADRGAIAPGQRADLVLLGGNPLADLSALRQVKATIVDGRLFDWPERRRFGGGMRAPIQANA